MEKLTGVLKINHSPNGEGDSLSVNGVSISASGPIRETLKKLNNRSVTVDGSQNGDGSFQVFRILDFKSSPISFSGPETAQTQSTILGLPTWMVLAAAGAGLYFFVLKDKMKVGE